jgi:nucleoid-associated protein YgaU
MKNYLSITNTTALVALAFAISACSSQDEMVAKPAPKPAAPAAKAEAKAEAKAPAAKATKIAGDVGLLDTEKNYLIIVTKDGKLVTVDYDSKFQPTERGFKPAKIADIGLGSAATVVYTTQGDKNIASSVEYLPAKGE